MGVFTDSIQDVSDDITKWHFVAYDQLNHALLPDDVAESNTGLLFIETKMESKTSPIPQTKVGSPSLKPATFRY